MLRSREPRWGDEARWGHQKETPMSQQFINIAITSLGSTLFLIFMKLVFGS